MFFCSSSTCAFIIPYSKDRSEDVVYSTKPNLEYCFKVLSIAIAFWVHFVAILVSS
jgi:hypothetical protein